MTYDANSTRRTGTPHSHAAWRFPPTAYKYRPNVVRERTTWPMAYNTSISTTPLGTPGTAAPRINHLIDTGTALIVSPCVTMNATPLAIDIMASVTMNEGIRSTVASVPLIAPAAAHIPTAPKLPKIIPITPADSPPARSRISRAETTADRATRMPTDRSIPPAIITIVMPIAMIAMITL